MSVESVRAFFAQYAPEIGVIETEASTATVELAAQAHGVEPGQIAKTLSLRINGGDPVLIVARGDARIDNRKIKAVFGGKARMLPREEVLELTGHPVGGVCPFGLTHDLQVYCDSSLRGYEQILPAAGSPNSAVIITPQQLAELVNGQWVDVCSVPEGAK